MIFLLSLLTSIVAAPTRRSYAGLASGLTATSREWRFVRFAAEAQRAADEVVLPAWYRHYDDLVDLGRDHARIAVPGAPGTGLEISLEARAGVGEGPSSVLVVSAAGEPRARLAGIDGVGFRSWISPEDVLLGVELHISTAGRKNARRILIRLGGPPGVL